MVEKKSKEEYEATAMLLGRRFDPRSHTMWLPGSGAGDSPYYDELDADTLEQLDRAEMDRRFARANYEHVSITPNGNKEGSQDDP